jgi:hypothetical protein
LSEVHNYDKVESLVVFSVFFYLGLLVQVCVQQRRMFTHCPGCTITFTLAR